MTENRESKNEYAYKELIEPLHPSTILDVGCGGNLLKRYHNKVTGVDNAGTPDVLLDLEKQSLLDHFGINSFDCVVCFDVLEHVDDLHGLLKQIIRISKSHVVLSFPNELNWHLLIKMRHNREREFGFFPRNRHKWFISYEDSLQFIKYVANKYNLKIVRYGPYQSDIGKVVHKLIKGVFPNLMPQGAYVVFRKRW